MIKRELLDFSRQAFPVPYNSNSGMTLRQWFAGMAMQALLTVMRNIKPDESDIALIAEKSYQMADQMLNPEVNKVI